MNFFDKFFAAREEFHAQADESHKDCNSFALGSFEHREYLDFPSFRHMNAAVQKTLASADDFYAPGKKDPGFTLTENMLTFRSQRSDGTVNDVVHVRMMRRSRQVKKAVVIIPHWNAKQDDYLSLARCLLLGGFAVFILTLPHHGKRATSAPDHIANEFLNANLGAAIASIRQSVLDVRHLVDWLDFNGYEKIHLVGVSLGSCVASLVTAFEPRISRCALLVTAGDFAETVWTGRATSRILGAIEDHINREQLANIWAIISPINFVDRIVANDSPLLMISCRRDAVVQFKLAAQFASTLVNAGANLKWRILPCGHYTLGLFPFNLITVHALLKFLRS